MAIVLDGSNGITTNSGTVISASTIGVGGATPSTSGAGITFPATQSASTDANTLDDYEEGTWTPDLRFGNATTGITYSNRGGRYTKVGNAVYFSVRITLSNRGSATGAAQIYGLPFAVGNSSNWADYAGATLAYSDATSGWNVTLQMTLDQGQTYIVFRYNNGTNNVGFTQANFSNSTDVILSGFYFA